MRGPRPRLRLARAWTELRRQVAADHDPSPPTLESFFGRVGWESDRGTAA